MNKSIKEAKFEKFFIIWKGGFAKVSKNLATDLKTSLIHQNNYVEDSTLVVTMSKLFQHCSLCLKFLYNYFYDLIKLFSVM